MSVSAPRIDWYAAWHTSVIMWLWPEVKCWPQAWRFRVIMRIFWCVLTEHDGARIMSLALLVKLLTKKMSKSLLAVLEKDYCENLSETFGNILKRFGDHWSFGYLCNPYMWFSARNIVWNFRNAISSNLWQSSCILCAYNKHMHFQ